MITLSAKGSDTGEGQQEIESSAFHKDALDNLYDASSTYTAADVEKLQQEITLKQRS